MNISEKFRAGNAARTRGNPHAVEGVEEKVLGIPAKTACKIFFNEVSWQSEPETYFRV